MENCEVVEEEKQTKMLTSDLNEKQSNENESFLPETYVNTFCDAALMFTHCVHNVSNLPPQC